MSPRIICIVLLSAALATAEETAKEEKVTKLDGKSFFGIVEITDDYTVRVKSDTGIQNIPLALLGEKDFQKYGFKKDRAKDGKFWSERQDALEKEKESNPNDKEDAAIEIKLTEIAPLQPLIDAYEKSVADKKKDAAKTGKADDTPGRSLFSQTGIPGLSNQPFTGMNSTPLQPAASAGATAVQSASGVMGALPTAP